MKSFGDSDGLSAWGVWWGIFLLSRIFLWSVKGLSRVTTYRDSPCSVGSGRHEQGGEGRSNLILVSRAAREHWEGGSYGMHNTRMPGNPIYETQL